MDPFTLAAIAGIGSSIIGGITGSNAADAQAKSAADAQRIQQQQFQSNQDLLRPQIEAGDTARSYALGLNGLPGGVDQSTANRAFTTSPGYAFRLQQGVNAIDQSAVNRGTANSGATMKALSDYGQNTGSAEFGNFYNRLMGLAGGGASATGQAAQLGQNYGDNSSNIALGLGQQKASSYTNTGNAISGGLQGMAGLYAQNYRQPNSAPYNPANGITPQPQSYYQGF